MAKPKPKKERAKKGSTPKEGTSTQGAENQAALFSQYLSCFDKPFPWQQAQWSSVVQRVQSQREPQAWLVAGPAGTGKRLFVHWWLKWRYCRAVREALAAGNRDPLQLKACGQCPDCVQVVAHSHADILMISPEEGSKSVKIDQVRQVIAFSQQTAKRSGVRTVVIEPAQAMPEAAQNALLKTLEEPGYQTQLILIADRAQGLLPTIASRTQRLNCPVPSRAIVADWLHTLPSGLLPADVSPDQALALLGCVHGAPLHLLSYLQSSWATARQELAQALEQSDDHPTTLTHLSTQWSQWPLKERLEVVLALMQELIKTRVKQACEHNSHLALKLEKAFQYHDLCLKLFRQVQTSVSLNEVLLWEKALIYWQKFKTEGL